MTDLPENPVSGISDEEIIIPEDDASDSETGSVEGVLPDSVMPVSEGSGAAERSQDSDHRDGISQNDFSGSDDDLDDLEDGSSADDMRSLRRRRRMFEGLAQAFGMDDTDTISIMKMLDGLVPDGDRLSTSDDVIDRLEYAFRDLGRHPSSLVFNRKTTRPGRPVDILNAPERFKHNAVLDSIMESEEDLLKALFVNERTMAGLSHWVSEHQQIRSLLMAEMVRRSTISEQWRHMLPKYMLPIFSMIQASGASQKMARVNGALFNRIRDAIIEWSEGALTREFLVGAAARTEDEFLTALKGDYASRMGSVVEADIAENAPEKIPDVPSDIGSDGDALSSGDESFEELQTRLRMLLLAAREDQAALGLGDQSLVLEADLIAADRLVNNLMMVEALDGGIAADGRVMFRSMNDFFDRLNDTDSDSGLPDTPLVESAVIDMVGHASDGQTVGTVDSTGIQTGDEAGSSLGESVSDSVPEQVPEQITTPIADSVSEPVMDGVDQGEPETQVSGETGSGSIGKGRTLPPVQEDMFAGKPVIDPVSGPVSDGALSGKKLSATENISPEILPEKNIAEIFEGNVSSIGLGEPEIFSEKNISEGEPGEVSSDQDAGVIEPVVEPVSGPIDPVELVEIRMPDGDHGSVIFAPDWVSPWPQTVGGLESVMDALPRSSGISRSMPRLSSSEAFAGWTTFVRPSPYGHISIRRHFDASDKAGKEGAISPVEWSRPEIGPGTWQASVVDGVSPVLGRSHALMLPPNSSLGWYGRELGWSEADIRALTAFGSPARPESVTAKGDPAKLAEAMRGVARMHLQKLLANAPAHFLSERAHLRERHEIATEHMMRWWIFMLLARHRTDDFDLIFTRDFFEGVEGPDFFVEESGISNFGTLQSSSHVMLHRKGAFDKAASGSRGMSGSPVSGPPPRP